ncbi:MAG TPA: 23S rRNA (uracil(1939)-C(5))-methyltransferase RlmD [Terriglobales bacterium]|nr:23S rRNA (uracil(1939)-C(5))-methyltransferase RlmD [Terriglobales bacterium]
MILTIEKLVYGGDGLARLPADEHGRGKTVFMPFVLEGEQVEASLVEQKPGFARARAEKIVQGSEWRAEPRCPYFLRCGGCHYQHASYEHQLQIKAAVLKENLRRIAKLELENELEIHPSPPWNYRNRTRFKIQTSPQFALGYYKFGSHELLPVEECPISSPLINRVMAAFWEMGRAGKMAEGILELELFANAEDTELLVEAYCAPSIDKSAAEQWTQEARLALPEIAGAVVFIGRNALQPELWVEAGAKELTYNTAHASYRVSVGAFFQVNRHLTDELVRIVTEGRSGTTALDLYAGVGLFSSVLNREFERVIAVESSPTSYADLLYNSAANVKGVRATVEQYLENAGGKLHPDFVVVDPPRAGLSESVIRNLVKLGAPRVTYVSCDPATLSRDLRALLQSGYRVEQAHLVDLFPQTYHLESVFHLVR